eukprot:CAMPEP_0174761158 /NCGR_PEP_ID=MMETSP1094-20130205/109137_1 /TAXON_ID=156173 /ORGANISM="Chrysochromulina brevifilum, Strain UTEX LB 985" /LENGTH=139 /DNA_ID=CAMNT_0015967105 /DNA_START=103 /DNA_END=524 /DNA_ORIENTATION=+
MPAYYALNSSVEFPVCHEIRVAYRSICAVSIPFKYVAAAALPQGVGERLLEVELRGSGHRDHEPRIRRRYAPRACDGKDITPGVEAVIVAAKTECSTDDIVTTTGKRGSTPVRECCRKTSGVSVVTWGWSVRIVAYSSV